MSAKSPVLLSWLFIMTTLAAPGWSREWSREQKATLALYKTQDVVSPTNGTTIFFYGHRISDSKYGLDDDRALDRLYRLDDKSDKAEPVFSEEDFAKYHGANSQFDVNYLDASPQGALLAIGRIQPIKPGEYAEDILLVNLKSRAVRVLLADGKLNRNYHFSPDGKYLAYESYPTDFWSEDIMSNKLEGHSVKIIDLKSGTVQIVRSPPDGKKVPYCVGESGAWSPDSRYFAFVYTPEVGQEVCIYDLKTRELKKTRCGASDNVRFENNNRLCVPHFGENVYFDTDMKKLEK